MAINLRTEFSISSLALAFTNKKRQLEKMDEFLFSVAELEDPILLEDMTVLNPCMVVILPALQRHLRPIQPMEFSVPYRQLLHLQVHQS